MYKKIIFLLSISLILASCTKQNGRSDAYGNFEATEVIVSAEMPGKIIGLSLAEGDNVSKNETAALIDTMQLSLSKELLLAKKEVVSARNMQITAQIRVQQEQLKTLEIEQNRLNKLIKEKAATPQQLDNIEGKIRVTKETIKSIKTQYAILEKELKSFDQEEKILKDKLRKCRVLNPVSGVVLQKYAEEGELANQGKPLYKIADLSTLDLRIYVTGSQLAGIKLGQQVEVLIDKENSELDKLTGTISWISSKAEFTPKIIQTKEERVNLVYAVKVKVKNDGRLKIGMPGEVNFK